MELDGKSYHKPEDLAEAMLSSHGIDTKLNLEILGSAPYANQLTPEKFDIAKEKLANANEVLPNVKELLKSTVLSMVLNESPNTNLDEMIVNSSEPQRNTYKALQLIDFLLRQPEDALTDMNFNDKKAFQLAILQEGINLTKKIHRKIEDSDLKKMMLSFTVYYSALQVLIIGMQTNSILLLHDQKSFMETDTDFIGMAITMITPDGHEKTKIKMLFEGYTILDDKKTSDGASYLVLRTNGPDGDTQ